MKIYISGPITGKESFSVDFDMAENLILKNGHTPVNPVYLGCCLRINNKENSLPEPVWNDYMRMDIKEMVDCEAVLAVGDFWHSRGAMLELRIAESIGLLLFRMESGLLKPLKLNKKLIEGRNYV